MQGEFLWAIVLVLAMTISSVVLFIRNKISAGREVRKITALSQRIAKGESVRNDLPEFRFVIKTAHTDLDHFELEQYREILIPDVRIETPGRTFIIISSLMPDPARLVLILSTTVSENFYTGITPGEPYRQQKYVFVEMRHDKMTGHYIFRSPRPGSTEERSLMRDAAFVIEEYLFNEMELHE
ncbi:MAG TPA: hypothetical protein VL651_14720 [Bacteroidia bacterium]|jgi:hypothetical protein|nr:hypothetical protein [Bacteroidia bacterium]